MNHRVWPRLPNNLPRFWSRSGLCALFLILLAPWAQAQLPRVFLRDVVVKNTDNPNVQQTIDSFSDAETSIAVNPMNNDQIAITAFEFDLKNSQGAWTLFGGQAPLWYTPDGGVSWTRELVV